MVAGILYLGHGPTTGHNHAILFLSGTQLITDDFVLPQDTPRNEEFCRNLYLIRLVPKQHRG